MFTETTGSRLTYDDCKKMISNTLSAGGGTIFIDEAYQLTAAHNSEGRKVLDFLLAEMENNIGKIIFIVAGYNKEMEEFYEHNPGLTSRVPWTFQFKDYEDHELLAMLQNQILKKWSARMKVEDGLGGLYMRIAARRVGRGRGRPGFGNARSVENAFSRICDRQSDRLSKSRSQGKTTDDFLIAKEDLIGPHPSTTMTECPAWKKLQGMIGLTEIKETVTSLLHIVQTNYDRELKELQPNLITLNRVFLGNPGTGKTTVAKIFGQILAHWSLLSNGEGLSDALLIQKQC